MKNAQPISYDLIIIGGGPGGYAAAIRATQLGMSVACIDENAQLGGTCLRVGCIPSKALLESSRRYAEVCHDLAPHGVRVGDVRLNVATMQERKSQIVSKLAAGIDGLFKQADVTRYLGRGRLTAPGQVVVTSQEGERALTARHVLIATGRCR